MAESLVLDNLRKTYLARGREPFEAVKGINLECRPGELVALLGPSGCGKTTTLRMIAGLETVTAGDIRIGAKSVPHLPPGKRDVGVGFESYALYPPLNVRENLAFGLKARRAPDAMARVDAIAERLQMTELLPLRPSGLSSGQKQRVALARALIRNPPVLLLDEPLSHLDASHRQRVRRELKKLQREFGYTTIMVTHDQLEALTMADRMAVMDGGVIQQFGTPDEIFDDPANQFVADFVGEPKINLTSGTVERGTAGNLVRIGNGGSLAVAATTAANGDRVVVGLRPQDCIVTDDSSTGIGGQISVFENLLEFGLATLRVGGLDEALVVQLPASSVDRAAGEWLRVTAPPERVYLFDPDSGARIR